MKLAGESELLTEVDRTGLRNRLEATQWGITATVLDGPRQGTTITWPWLRVVWFEST